jgi:GT2 family glycosyltransferase
MSSKKIVSVVIGSYNRRRYLRLAIESVRAELARCGRTGEIIVVDGGSTDGALSWLTKQRDVLTIVHHNRGEWRGRPVERRSWGYFMNLGFRCAQGKYICMLSDDCLVVPGAIEAGCARFDERLAAGERLGAVAFYWRNWPEQEPYRVGLAFGGRMFVNHGLYLREALAEIGYADEESFAFYHADADLCLRMWDRGWRCVDAPSSFVEHYAHANAKVRRQNLERERRDWAAFEARWAHLGMPERDWIERSFTDPQRTARAFRAASGWRLAFPAPLFADLGSGTRT